MGQGTQSFRITSLISLLVTSKLECLLRTLLHPPTQRQLCWLSRSRILAPDAAMRAFAVQLPTKSGFTSYQLPRKPCARQAVATGFICSACVAHTCTVPPVGPRVTHASGWRHACMRI